MSTRYMTSHLYTLSTLPPTVGTRRKRWPLWLLAVLLVGGIATSAVLWPITTTKPTFEQVSAGYEAQKEGQCNIENRYVPCVLATKNIYIIYEGGRAAAIVEDGETGPRYLWKK